MESSPTDEGMMKGMVKDCCKRCKWCPLFPIVFGIIFLLLGYYLSAEVVRVLWMVLALFWVAMGVCCFMMMRGVCKDDICKTDKD